MTAKLPLDDIRVIDLTVARAGPTCVRQLADWGADVVGVERPADPAAPGLTGGSLTAPTSSICTAISGRCR